MNKVLSQAIKKAVSEFKPQVDQKSKTNEAETTDRYCVIYEDHQKNC